MPFLQLTLPCTLAEQPRVERVLEAAGALSVTLQDAHLDAADEQAIFEPGVGELPLWDALSVTALFDGDADAVALLAALQASDASLDWSQARLEQIADQDWQRAWLDAFAPMRFGRRTWIVPWDHEVPREAQAGDAAVVRLDPGLAFGSGTHATTALCLAWLDALADAGSLRDAPVLDFGCGSGILALAALRLGAALAVGIDNDPQALLATADNAARNDLQARLQVFAPGDAPTATYPVVVANILASALVALRGDITAAVAPGGVLAMSGILDGQQDEVIAAYADAFEDIRCQQLDGWVRIDAHRRRLG